MKSNKVYNVTFEIYFSLKCVFLKIKNNEVLLNCRTHPIVTSKKYSNISTIHYCKCGFMVCYFFLFEMASSHYLALKVRSISQLQRNIVQNEILFISSVSQALPLIFDIKLVCNMIKLKHSRKVEDRPQNVIENFILLKTEFLVQIYNTFVYFNLTLYKSLCFLTNH